MLPEKDKRSGEVGVCIYDRMAEGEKDFNDDHREITHLIQSIRGFQECDKEDVETWIACNAEDCGFQMLNDDEDNESNKGPSNADTFSALETTTKWYEQQSRVLSYSTTAAAHDNWRPCSVKTKIGEFGKECAAKWNAMNDEQKEPFLDSAGRDRERYKREMSIYKPARDANKPKRPGTAFMIFMADFRKEMAGKEPEGGVAAMAKLGGERWRSMSDEDKAPYVEQQLEAKLRYEHSMEEYRRSELWFQQDGATCHTARATIDLLKDTFGDHLISRFGPVNWPPRSCDLTPLDYFFVGLCKVIGLCG
ncbi:high mobility group-T protein [Trichonephila clavipes]|nr:high mobility group-T protein [Trichonephila clavipes]